MSPGHTGTTRRNVLKVSGSLLGGAFAGSTVVAAESEDRYLVRTRGDRELGVDVVHEMPGVDAAVVRASERALKNEKAVRAFAPDVELHLDAPREAPTAPEEAAPADEASPTDETFYPLQWDKQVQDLSTAHEQTQGEGTRVAIIDSGIPESHPDLAGPLNTTLSRNFAGDTGNHEPRGVQYHGTHVGGIVAAADNGSGVVGTAPATDLVDCRVFGTGGGASFGSILAAVAYSANVGADVANLSLGAYPVPRQALGSFYGQFLNSVMTYANSRGTLLVIAAGNDTADLQHDRNFVSLPNEGAQGLAVSATTSIGHLSGDRENPGYAPAGYTNYGTNAVTLGAPGGDVPEGGSVYDLVYNAIPQAAADFFFEEGVPPYAYISGTSMAAPQVAGAAALVKSANPDYSANQVEAALERAAEVPAGYDRAYYGSGFLNVVDAL